MDKKTGKNNKLIQKNKNAVSAADSVQAVQPIAIKKRGRPKGSKNSVKRIDKDPFALIDKDTNARFITHGCQLMKLSRIDLNDDKAVSDRIDYYFNLCKEQEIKPSVAGLAFAFGMSRINLFQWLNGDRGKLINENSVNSIKIAYNYINLYYENMMNTGNINPVAGIFLMKNNMGYRDQTDYNITANQDKQDNITDITNRAGLLT